MKKTLHLILITLILGGCSVMKNYPQESKFMKVTGGGYFLSKDRQLEETYGLSLDFKNPPSSAKYLIADFELPNNAGLYERKIFPINNKQSSIAVKSNPIYGFNYGLYYVNLYLAEDKKGERVIDSLKQSIKLYSSLNKGRDYASQYTLFEDKKEIKKVIIIYPNKRKKDLITAEIPNKFKIGHANVGFDESIVEYVPNNETVYNWTKIITIKENKVINQDINKPHIYASVLGNAMHKKFSKLDKDMQITYAGIVNGEFINVETPNFEKLITKANEVGAYVDYADYSTIKRSPYQREYLVLRTIKSDVSIWEFQCTVRYDKRWSKEKIESFKKEAKNIVGSLQYVKSNPIDDLEKLATENGVKNFNVESQRLDDRELNIKFKATEKSPYK